MDIRLLADRDTQDAKALWKQAFGDSDAFIDTYFKNKILPANSIGLFDGGLVSVVHMLPFTIRVQGRDLQSAYIAGAATDNARCGAGHMRTLLFESLKLMKQRGILMTHLYPFKHSFYEKFGWATYTYVRKYAATNAAAQSSAHVVETKDDAILSSLYETMMRRFDGYVVRGQREWHWRLEELFSDGGRVIVLMRGDVPSAYMMVYETDGKAEAIETVYADKEDAHALADYLLLSGLSEVKYNIAAFDETAEPHGMARVVDADALLREFGAESLLEHVRITDDFAPWNNIGSASAAKEMSIQALAQYVHRGRAANKYDDDTEKQRYFGDGEKFIEKPTCIFEEY